MNELQVFKNNDFGQVRTVEENGKVLFCGSDVAKALGYSNERDALIRHCKGDGVMFHDIIDSLGREQQAKFINEGNLYRLIANSKLPTAEKFESWVFDEVLPTIRKHGAYATDGVIDNILNNPEFGIKLLTELKSERASRMGLEIKIEQDKPKVLFADSVIASHSSILIGDLAKLIKQNGVDIGRDRLFAWLRNNGYLMKQNGTSYNMPTQKSMDMGLFEVKETSITHSNGCITISRTVKCTGKAQVYFINKFLEIA